MSSAGDDTHNTEYIAKLEALGDALADGLQALSDEYLQAAWLEDIEAWRQLRSEGARWDSVAV